MQQDIYGALGFYTGAPLEQLKRVFQNAIMPVMDQGWKNRDAANHAMFLETLVYEILVKASETEESFTFAYDLMRHALIEIGTKELGIKPRMWGVPGPQPRVAFWLPGSAILAHTAQLLVLLRGLQGMGAEAPIKPVVYVGAPTSKELRDVVLEHGADIRFLADHERPQFLQPPIVTLERLADAVKTDGVQALVFVSTPVHLLTAVAMRVAPAIIWWSMKWYNLQVDVDERMTPRRGDVLEIAGRPWRCGHVCLPTLVDPARKDDMRRRLRDRYKIGTDQVAVGWMGRDEKLTPEYGRAIATLLETNRDAVFLYTGRRRMPAFEETLRTVADRVRHIGWVDVASTMWVLDVYADSFPMGSGHTAFAAMQAGVPVVTLMTEDNKKNSAAAHIFTLWNDELLESQEILDADAIMGEVKKDELPLPFTADPLDWHWKLCQLIQSKEMREDTGMRQQKFVHRFLMDQRRYAQQTSRIILETISKKTGIPVEAMAPAPAPVVTEKANGPQADQEHTAGADAAGAEPGTSLAGSDEGSESGRNEEAGKS